MKETKKNIRKRQINNQTIYYIIKCILFLIFLILTNQIQKSLNQLHLRIVTSKEKIPQNFEKLQYEEELIEEYFQNYKDISNIKMKYMKKLMQHPQKLVNIFQEGYDENLTESTSSQQSNKSMIKEPFNTNILSLNIQDSYNQNNLMRIQALKN
ncbi:transmembrane protein, putative (macronuclear) [Tetrahymena thermophila SB210]|uniref:Transmembrane protein, putative n=1 Tax=Tetrahymena thermophila (strain SB210) TaxID=312017 RepID=Q22DV6_TETTS|nr:transmembrane protein, putative [Tetrahymena thermophila SB210]EAR83449.2 transmembrane protein, putative [Tetrahymena thermophila SB210]|eukprot:XP_001031112.2 transmembrane protein, putative [Tetrahymena thermophila SB210]